VLKSIEAETTEPKHKQRQHAYG